MPFFIRRPIFASVIALLTVLAGGISMMVLPIAQYPRLVPPQIQVSTQYIGGGAEVVADTTTAPLEEQINGAEGMAYMSSTSTNNGNSLITVTFDFDVDPNIAQVEVLNRANQARAELPAEVDQVGLSIQKSTPELVVVVALYSPNGTLDQEYFGNYADIHVVDALARIPGVGQVLNFGLRKYAIRIWVDPGKLTALGLTATDVVNAVKAQNRSVAAGRLGAAPAPSGQQFEYQVNTVGRLEQVEQFAAIILRAAPDGAIVRVGDVARVELGTEQYDWVTDFSGRPSGNIGIFQESNANALEIKRAVVAEMERLKKDFPDDLAYATPYDTTLFVVQSTKEVMRTLWQAILLVTLVIFVFLQSWRTALIPILTIPVSLIGTFAVMQLIGFSINTLTLLGLVLAVGLVVDDAIVVVENVRRRMEQGATDIRETTGLALAEVRSPIVATSLSLIAVFVPVAFMPGLAGRLYNQFGVTIAISVALSAINSLSLSPALCAVLLRPSTGPSRFAPFRWFNAAFDRFTGWYAGLVRVLARVWPLSLLAFVGLVFGLYVLFGRIGTGFVPEEDQGYFMVMIDMPPASSFARTQAVTAEAAEILRGVPGVSDTVGVGGFDVVTFLQDPGMGAIFTLLKPWSERTTEALSVEGIMATARMRLEGISEARIGVINAPAIPGLSSTAGLELEIQDLGDRGPAALADVTEAYLAAARKRPELGPMLTTYSAGLPQRFLDVDRTKAMTLGVDLDDLFDTLQVNVGSMYVNQFNRYGRVYRTYVQAESEARANEDDLGRLRVRNAAGEMIDLNALATVKPMFGPFNVDRYNLYRSALVIGSASDGTSSGAAQQAMEEVADEVLPDGYTTQWTSTVYQQRQAGTVAPIIFCLSLVVVFLVLAAQYESWTMPLMVILAIPIGILGAIAGLILRKLDLDIYAQVGLLMLIGLTAKNAILIVQFAKVRREAGTPIMDAAVEAARIRLRPILMTALAFIFGVAPLAFASGAGAYARVGIGTVVGSGVLASTVLIVFVPLFYIVIQGARERVVGPPPEVRE